MHKVVALITITTVHKLLEIKEASVVLVARCSRTRGLIIYLARRWIWFHWLLWFRNINLKNVTWNVVWATKKYSNTKMSFDTSLKKFCYWKFYVLNNYFTNEKKTVNNNFFKLLQPLAKIARVTTYFLLLNLLTPKKINNREKTPMKVFHVLIVIATHRGQYSDARATPNKNLWFLISFFPKIK